MLENLKKRFKLIFSLIGIKALIRDFYAIIKFLNNKDFTITFKKRLYLIIKYLKITINIDCPHTQEDILTFVSRILMTPSTIKGCFIEAGCYKGGSTTKFSLAAKIINRKLVVFDSFKGIPNNIESQEKTLFGSTATFREGDYYSNINEVKANITKYGCIDLVEFRKGWFQDTMPNFNESIAAIYLDVDLESSTRTCLKYLYPLLQPGGYLFSQDGHLPRIVKLFLNKNFWKNKIKCEFPTFISIGKKKLIEIKKI